MTSSTAAGHRAVPLPGPGLLVTAGLLLAATLLGCPAVEEGFEAELLLTSAANQSPFTDVGRLEITFEYQGSESRIYPVQAPFDEAPVLEDLPRAEAGEVGVLVRGQVEDAAADGGWRTVADGRADGFAMPPEEPVEVLVLMKGQIALMPGGLDSARGDGAAFLLADGRVVVIGGADGETTVPGVEVLLADPEDPYSGQVVAELPRMAHAAFLVEDTGTEFDGQVVVVGGDTECGDFLCFNDVNPEETAAFDVVAFDPDGDDVREVDTIINARLAGKPVRLPDDRWAIVGGFDVNDWVYFPYIFDSHAGGVAWASSDTDGREQHTLTPVDLGNGKVLIAGGVSGSMSTETLLWSEGAGAMATGAMNETRMRHTATLLASGSVFLAGGAVGTSFGSAGTARGSAEIYRPDTGEFELLTASLSYPRQRHVAAPLGDGSEGVLICGGVDKPGEEGSPVLACEIYSPLTGDFETHAGLELVAGGEGMMAAPLADGSVLLMGGLASGEPLDEVHLYYP